MKKKNSKKAVTLKYIAIDPFEKYKVDQEGSHSLDNYTLTGYPSKDYPFLKRKIYDMDRNYDIPDIDTTMFEFFVGCIGEDRLDDIFIEYLDEKITYREFIKLVYKVMKSLKQYGIKAGDLVAVCMPNTPEVRAVIYACSYLGVTVHPIDPRTNPNALKEMVKDANLFLMYEDLYPKYKDVFSSKNMVIAGAIECFPKVRLIKEAFKLFRNHEKLPEKVKIEKSNCVTDWKSFISRGRNYCGRIERFYRSGRTLVVESTSGTTGIPKGVMLSDKNVNYVAEQHFKMELEYEKGDSVLDLLLPSIAYWFGSFHALQCMGLKIYVMPALVFEEFPFVLKKLKPNNLVLGPIHLEQIVKHERAFNQLLAIRSKPNARNKLKELIDLEKEFTYRSKVSDLLSIKDDLSFNNAFKELLISLDLGDLSFIKHIITGGAILPQELLKECTMVLENHGCYVPVTDGYGLTEGCGVIGMNPDRNRGKEDAVWFPLPDNEIAIYKKGTFEECKFDEEGELCIKKNQNSSVMKGYKNDLEATRNAIITHPDGSIWLHSGDIAYIDKEGFVHVKGRFSELIFKAGFKINPTTVEEVVLKHPAVSQCKIVGIPDSHFQTVPGASIVLKDFTVSRETLIAEIKDLCTKYLTYDYFTPDVFEIIDTMPVNNSGKPDTEALKRILIEKREKPV